MFYRTEKKDNKLHGTLIENSDFLDDPEVALKSKLKKVGKKKMIAHLDFLEWLKEGFKNNSITHLTPEFSETLEKYLSLTTEEINSFVPSTDLIKICTGLNVKAIRTLPFIESLEKVCLKRRKPSLSSK